MYLIKLQLIMFRRKGQKMWLFEFNFDKCKVLHIELSNIQHSDYTLRNFKLTKSMQEKHLGVLTSDTLLWNDQIESCTS